MTISQNISKEEFARRISAGHLRRHGSLAERLWRRVDKTEGCWNWTGPVVRSGYGVFMYRRAHVIVHRAAYELTYGPISDGLYVCHHCDNKRCVRPDHLFLGTHTDNMRDMSAKGRSHRGAKHVKALLDEQKVREVRRLYALDREIVSKRPRGRYTMEQIAAMMGVSDSTVEAIISRRCWGWLS